MTPEQITTADETPRDTGNTQAQQGLVWQAPTVSELAVVKTEAGDFGSGDMGILS